MQPKKIWSNLAVTDLDRTTKFYTALGFKPNGEDESQGLTSFLIGENNFVMHFFLREVLQNNFQSEIVDSQKANEVFYTLSAESIGQVNDWEKEVEQAGGTVITRPAAFGEGYYGFVFADPDGHRFNVFYMEGL